MKKISFFIVSAFVLMQLFISCTKESTNIPEQTKTIVLPAEGASVINANREFAFDFFHATLIQDPKNNNKLISPLSIYLALSMVYNGADNATKDSIAKTLKLSGIDINSLNSVCHSLLTQFPEEDNRVQLDIANSIWYRQNSYQPLPAFLNAVQENYNASVQGLDFNDPKSVATINKWVVLNTNSKIPSIIESIPPDDLMYIINAIYFNGKWQYAFKTSDTHNDIFYLYDGSKKNVPFMSQQIRTKMFQNGSFTLAELPYGGGKSFSMYILKPGDSQESLNAFAASLTQNMLSDAINKMDTFGIELKIPKWQYAYEVADMKPELSKLGMGIAFTENADFSKMYDRSQVKVQITKAIHKTFIKVNEEGTEAAAVTAVGMGTTSISIPRVLKLDHPFLYAIIEKQTGAVLFLGMVNDPLSK